MSTYQGPRDGGGNVTPNLPFRGAFPRWLSARMYLNSHFCQQYGRPEYRPTSDYVCPRPRLHDRPGHLGGRPKRHLHRVRQPQRSATTLPAQWARSCRLHPRGRTIPSLLHCLPRLTKAKCPPNPGNPYVKSETQQGFGTFGPPDFASTLAEVAKIALNAVWYQKWNVHLRHRPESGGGIVELISTGMGTLSKGKFIQTFSTRRRFKKLQQVWELSPVTALSGRVAISPGVSNRSRHCGRRLH